jgi:hypothetical protein
MVCNAKKVSCLSHFTMNLLALYCCPFHPLFEQYKRLLIPSLSWFGPSSGEKHSRLVYFTVYFHIHIHIRKHHRRLYHRVDVDSRALGYHVGSSGVKSLHRLLGRVSDPHFGRLGFDQYFSIPERLVGQQQRKLVRLRRLCQCLFTSIPWSRQLRQPLHPLQLRL